jgi:glycosyltransferase involved in cell wall biosynthesis
MDEIALKQPAETDLLAQAGLVPASQRISVIIPAYNEEQGIAQTLTALVNDPWLSGAEFIVMDDGSSDRTGEIARSVPRVRFIRHPYNRGYGSAICTGVRAATRDYICWFDSDGQHRVDDLVTVCKKLLDEQLEYCIGVRDPSSHQDPDRVIGKWLLRQAVNFSLGQSAPDFNSGLRGFRKDVLQRYLHLLPRRFGASTLTTLLMLQGDHYGATVPITVLERIGKSTVRQFRDGINTLNIILHIMLLFKPLKFFGLSGALLILTGLVYGILKALMIQEGFPVLASLLIILGVQSFFFGLLCDQVSAMRRERFN